MADAIMGRKQPHPYPPTNRELVLALCDEHEAVLRRYERAYKALLLCSTPNEADGAAQERYAVLMDLKAAIEEQPL